MNDMNQLIHTVFSVGIVVFLLSWVIGMCVQEIVVKKLVETKILPTYVSIRRSIILLKFLFTKEYKNLEDERLMIQCKFLKVFFVAEVVLLVVLAVIFVVATPHSSSKRSKKSDVSATEQKWVKGSATIGAKL